jgi:hypothetical protein
LLKRLLIPAAAFAVMAACAAPAGAAITIGSNLAATPNISPNIVGSQTSVQSTLDPTHTAPGGLTSPISGIVVRFRYKQSVAGDTPIVFRIVRPDPVLGLGTSTGAGTSPPLIPGGGIDVLPARMPISAGDAIGIDCCNGGVNDGFSRPASGPNIGAYLGWNNPTLADGGSALVHDNGDSNIELLANADIEPDADHDGYGDETQDLCPTNAAIQTACPTQPLPVTPKCKKAKKKKRAAAARAKKKKCAKKHKKK